MKKASPPPPTREQFKPPPEGSTSTLRLDVLELSTDASRNEPDRMGEDYRFTINGRAISKVKVGGVEDAELRFREFDLTFSEFETTEGDWFTPFQELKAGKIIHFDTGGYAVITDKWINLMLEPRAFRGFLRAIQAKDVSSMRLSLETDLLQLYWFDEGPLFIPDLEHQKYGRGYISQLSFKSKALSLSDEERLTPAEPPAGLAHGHMTKQLIETNKLLWWIAIVLTALLAGTIFHR